MKTPTLLLILLLATTAYAATVTVTPATVYETTTAWEQLDVNNYKGSSIITKITVDSPSLTITDAAEYLGWTQTQDADTAEWKNGTIETNVKDAAFEFQVSAPNVTSNSTVPITITYGSGSTVLNVTVLNDATPPAITGVKPNTYARANNAAQLVSANIIDAETSVSGATYTWNDCGSGPDSTIVLTKSLDTYAGTANFSGYSEGGKACYKFTAKNNPGETGTLTGELLFDGTAPNVSISSPTTFATETTDFKFTASDNIATTLSCEIKLDSTTLDTVNVTNGTTTTLTKNLTGFTEGSHTWTATCTDGVGLSATKAQAIMLDTAPPSIIIDYTPSIPRTQTSELKTTVTDTVGLASVNATFEGAAIVLTKSGDVYKGTISSNTTGTKTIVVETKDDAGHTTTKTATVTIVPNHIVTLTLSPDSTTTGSTITASGTITKDGNTTSTEVIVKTPSGNTTKTLSGSDYSSTFIAPDPGTYIITTEFTEAGYTYKALATLTVRTISAAPEPPVFSGDGAGEWRTSGYVKPPEPQAPTTPSNPVTPTQPQAHGTGPASQQYVPLPPESPRSALTPKGTGVFSLGGAVKWLAILLALALLIGLGVYSYNRRGPKEDGGIDWNGYFKDGS